MASHWNRGVAILKGLKVNSDLADNPDRIRDIGLATALGLQFQSGYHILRFYALREKLADAKAPAVKQRLLRQMRELVLAELRVDDELLPLAEADSRLGFHSEAEGYKYFPALLRWRMAQLQSLLEQEFRVVEAQATAHGPLFPDYTGEATSGLTYTAPLVAGAEAGALEGLPYGGVWDNAEETRCTHWLRSEFSPERARKCGYDPYEHLPVSEADRQGRDVVWKAVHTVEALYLGITAPLGASLQVVIEPQRTEPRRILRITSDGKLRYQRDDGYLPEEDRSCEVSTHSGERGWSAIVRIPFGWLGRRAPQALRIDIVGQLPIAEAPGVASVSWAEHQPVKGRLIWGALNPATDFGWLRLGR